MLKGDNLMVQVMWWDIGKLKIKKYGNINDYSMNVG